MLRVSLLVAFLTLILSACTQESQAPQPAAEPEEKADKSITTDEQKLSYGIGLNIGNSLTQQTHEEMKLDIDIVLMGLKDAYEDREYRVAPEELDAAVERIQEAQQAEIEALAQENLAAGKAFLEENGKREVITSTESGIQYEILTSGEGESPKAEDVVQVHYHGTLVDGSVFDSSVERDQPAQFPLNQVIPGWTEVLQLMQVGDKWKVYIPSELAYGERSPGPSIPPNSVLAFEIELLDIVK